MPGARRLTTILTASLAVALAAAGPASALDGAVEAQNYSKGSERQAIYSTPQYQQQLRLISQANGQEALQAQINDSERMFVDDLCWSGNDGCAGDVRLYDWQAKGYGIVTPVLFTARSGATISGHIWATRSGPARRPGIVITNGSVQAPERVYWFAAQALAKAGYVVMTWDPQGQGQSDTPGEGADQNEGVPAQSDGRPFFDGTQDALNFFFSTPSRPYVPVPSCNSATSHAAKQQRRVRAGLDAAFNPYAALLDPTRVGIAGHSYGAAGVSYIGQSDPRVKAIVAWDNLAQPTPGAGLGERPCVDPAARRPAPVTKPALGMSADYFIPPTPNTSDPVPQSKSVVSLAYSKAHVDTGEVIIRGGTHYDFDWVPNPGFPATLRGADEITWYTTAWFDKYVKGDPTADARLMTDRWRRDAQEAGVDPSHDANMFSFYYPSRLDIGLSGGGRFVCEDLRRGCAGLTSQDGVNGSYDYLSLARSPDSAGPGASVASRLSVAPLSGVRVQRCTSRRSLVVHIPQAHGLRVVRVTATVGARRAGASRGAAIRISLTGRHRGRFVVILRVDARLNGRVVHLRLTRTYRTCTSGRRASGPRRGSRARRGARR
jgi:dienelactone hydrolase